MSDFERSGMTFDEQAKRRSPGTWFADLGDRLARGLNNFDRPPVDEDEVDWEEYEEEEPEQPTAVADPVDWDPNPSQGRKRFPAALHGYDREAVDAHLAELENELAELKVRRNRDPEPAVQAELERVGEETSAILKVAHQQAAEITRRAQAQADRCVADAAANAVSMTEDAKRKLRQLDTETDAVWAERGRLIDDVRNVATSLFSLAEDAADRFPEEGDRRGPAEHAPVARAATSPAQNGAVARNGAPVQQNTPPVQQNTPPAEQNNPPAQRSGPATAPAQNMRPATAAGQSAGSPPAPPRGGAAPANTPSPVAAPVPQRGEYSRDLPTG
jgi:cell division septum initiation protein DivIVA